MILQGIKQLDDILEEIKDSNPEMEPYLTLYKDEGLLWNMLELFIYWMTAFW